MTGGPNEGLVTGFWRHLASAGPDAAADVEAALDDLASSGDEVLGRIAAGRVGLPRNGDAPVLRTVAVEEVRRPSRT